MASFHFFYVLLASFAPAGIALSIPEQHENDDCQYDIRFSNMEIGSYNPPDCSDYHLSVQIELCNTGRHKANYPIAVRWRSQLNMSDWMSCEEIAEPGCALDLRITNNDTPMIQKTHHGIMLIECFPVTYLFNSKQICKMVAGNITPVVEIRMRNTAYVSEGFVWAMPWIPCDMVNEMAYAFEKEENYNEYNHTISCAFNVRTVGSERSTSSGFSGMLLNDCFSNMTLAKQLMCKKYTKIWDRCEFQVVTRKDGFKMESQWEPCYNDLSSSGGAGSLLVTSALHIVQLSALIIGHARYMIY